MIMEKEQINWFWAHRRNASLHHMSFLMRGMAGKGWAPAVDFWFDHQIIIGVPGKGAYIFYDQDQLSSAGKYADIQRSIDTNPHFVRDFRRRTDEIFGAIFWKAMAVEETNLSFLSTEELEMMYRDFLGALLIAPFITVQLWGIEACFDENWKIMSFLRTRLHELGLSREFQRYREILSVNTGETVAFTEQKDFFRVADAIVQSEACAVFQSEDLENISKVLHEYSAIDELIERHRRKYEWMNKEYVSDGWSREKWLGIFREALNATETPKQKLQALEKAFLDLNQERNRIITQLNPPEDVRHALDSLAELIAQRDWTKGYMTKSLLSYHKLLGEIAQRSGVSAGEVLLYSYEEMIGLIRGELLSEQELSRRAKEGYALVIKGESFSLVSGKEAIEVVIQEEGISAPFETLLHTDIFKGLGASRGVIRGRARVIEDASRLAELEAGEILVTYMTTIEFTPAFRRAGGVVTDEGGMSCHAAIVSREFRLPCVVGTKVATRIILTGDIIEVDGAQGIVKVLERAKV
jgi:phosphohistidine swiveling domain-containing protein